MTSSRAGVVDASGLIAAIDHSDPHFDSVRSALNDRSRRWVVPALCVAEACYIIDGRFGAGAEADFLNYLSGIEVLGPLQEEWSKIASVVRQYSGLRVGGADASLLVLAERLNTDTIITLDRRHFRAFRPQHCEFFRLLPEL